jgi:hypothetical protein
VGQSQKRIRAEQSKHQTKTNKRQTNRVPNKQKDRSDALRWPFFRSPNRQINTLQSCYLFAAGWEGFQQTIRRTALSEAGARLVSCRLYRGDVMRAREDCQALLASIDKMPLSVNEMAVAFENGGRSINLFPVALHDARRKRLVRQDATGLLTLTVKGRKVLTRFRS